MKHRFSGAVKKVGEWCSSEEWDIPAASDFLSGSAEAETNVEYRVCSKMMRFIGLMTEDSIAQV